jgi:hypothetical protein
MGFAQYRTSRSQRPAAVQYAIRTVNGCASGSVKSA